MPSLIILDWARFEAVFIIDASNTWSTYIHFGNYNKLFLITPLIVLYRNIII